MIDEMYNYHENSFPAVRLSEKWETLSEKFEAAMADEQIKMFHNLCYLQFNASADEVRMAYKVGFKDGAKMILEVYK